MAPPRSAGIGSSQYRQWGLINAHESRSHMTVPSVPKVREQVFGGEALLAGCWSVLGARQPSVDSGRQDPASGHSPRARLSLEHPPGGRLEEKLAPGPAREARKAQTGRAGALEQHGPGSCPEMPRSSQRCGSEKTRGLLGLFPPLQRGGRCWGRGTIRLTCCISWSLG